jgi:hypothetical protein
MVGWATVPDAGAFSPGEIYAAVIDGWRGNTSTTLADRGSGR